MLGLVYLIDDHAPFQTSIRPLLEQAGYQVETFSSVEEFLSQLPNEDIFNMPTKAQATPHDRTNLGTGNIIKRIP